jgi:proline dehydrogenase
VDLGLAGKVAMVAGASRGLGLAVANALAAEGARVSLLSRDATALCTAAKKLEQEHAAQALAVPGDVRSADQLAAWHSATLERFGGVDLVFTNSGGPPAGGALAFDDQAWQEAFELLLLSAVRVVRTALPSLRARGGGAILLATSSAVKEPIPNLGLSTVLRAGVSALSKSLALELAADGSGDPRRALRPARGVRPRGRVPALAGRVVRHGRHAPGRRGPDPHHPVGDTMGIMRSALLAGSQNAWLREHAVRTSFVRRSVSRFMPGEKLEDALRAAAEQQRLGVSTILTHLGENLARVEEAEQVTQHYLEVLDKVAQQKLDAQISVKPTQLGLDHDPELCQRNQDRLIQHAEKTGNFVWIDMESSAYVERTLQLYKRSRAKSDKVGVALQAYLFRTAKDIEDLIPLGAAIRLVKGAYLEPPEVAYPKKADVDENFYKLACRLLAGDARKPGAVLHVATHDAVLVDRLRRHIAENGVPGSAYEFAMLYGIQRGLQQRLVADRQRLRVLISYGEYWFPWYMRRLAERPANVLFVLKNLFG